MKDKVVDDIKESLLCYIPAKAKLKLEVLTSVRVTTELIFDGSHLNTDRSLCQLSNEDV